MDGVLRKWLCVAAAVGLAACAGDDGDSVLAGIDYEPRPAASGVLPPPDYEGSAGVTANGSQLSITTAVWGDLCRTKPSATAELAGDQVTLTVRLRWKPDAGSIVCVPWIAETDITAVTTPLPAGTYRVTVRISYPDIATPFDYDAGPVSIE